MYTTEDGLTKIETTFDEDTVWLSLDQMAELFQRDKSTISRHIKNIFQEGELVQSSTVAKFATVQTEGTGDPQQIQGQKRPGHTAEDAAGNYGSPASRGRERLWRMLALADSVPHYHHSV